MATCLVVDAAVFACGLHQGCSLSMRTRRRTACHQLTSAANVRKRNPLDRHSIVHRVVARRLPRQFPRESPCSPDLPRPEVFCCVDVAVDVVLLLHRRRLQHPDDLSVVTPFRTRQHECPDPWSAGPRNRVQRRTGIPLPQTLPLLPARRHFPETLQRADSLCLALGVVAHRFVPPPVASGEREGPRQVLPPSVWSHPGWYRSQKLTDRTGQPAECRAVA